MSETFAYPPRWALARRRWLHHLAAATGGPAPLSRGLRFVVRDDATEGQPPRPRGLRFAAHDDATDGPEGPEGRSHRHGHGRRGRRGPGGPGPFGPGFGPDNPGFGPGGAGPFGPRPRGPRSGRGRAGRGDVRAAVLALLAEQPHHGYSIIGELAERSGGLWRASPGSVYPVLALLQDEGLVTSVETDGRRVFTLSDAGRAYVDKHADKLREPWSTVDTGHRRRAVSLFDGVRSIGSAAREVAHNGTEAQVKRALAVLDDARKSLYRILAENAADAADDGTATQPPSTE